MNYVITEGDPEKQELGYNGGIIYDLIKAHKPILFAQLTAEETLIPFIQRLEEDYKCEMLKLLRSGLNESEAREIAWPEITARFSM